VLNAIFAIRLNLLTKSRSTFLRRTACCRSVQKDEQGFPSFGYNFRSFAPTCDGCAVIPLAKPYPGKIDEMTTVFPCRARNAFYVEMIYQLCFPGSGRDFCQFAVVAKHIDQ
jgi:hypothetical protein